MATISYEGVAQPSERSGESLFDAKRFFFAQRLPTRSELIAAVEANGGQIVKQEKLADFIICDHLKRKLNPTWSTSWTFINRSIQNGILEDPNEHRAGPDAFPKSGVSSAPTKGFRTPFSAQDDLELAQWVMKCERKGHMIKGNIIYQTFAAMNPRHTAQSWRDRWIKFVSHHPQPEISHDDGDSPPPPSGYQKSQKAPAPSPTPPIGRDVTKPATTTSRLRNTAPRSAAEPSPTQIVPARGSNYSAEDINLLESQHDDILGLDGSREIAAWQAFAEVHRQHTADEWRNLWTELIKPNWPSKRADLVVSNPSFMEADISSSKSIKDEPSTVNKPRAESSRTFTFTKSRSSDNTTSAHESPRQISALTERSIETLHRQDHAVVMSPRQSGSMPSRSNGVLADEVAQKVEQERERDFFKKVTSWYSARQEKPVELRPRIGSQTCSLYRLWTVVCELGGYEVIDGTRDGWRQVAASLNVNIYRAQHMPDQLRQHYMDILSELEDADRDFERLLKDGIDNVPEMLHHLGEEKTYRGSSQSTIEDEFYTAPNNFSLSQAEDVYEGEEDDDDDLEMPPPSRRFSNSSPIPVFRKRTRSPSPSSDDVLQSRHRFALSPVSSKRAHVNEGDNRESEVPLVEEKVLYPNLDSSSVAAVTRMTTPASAVNRATKAAEDSVYLNLQKFSSLPPPATGKRPATPSSAKAVRITAPAPELEPETQDFHFPTTQAAADDAAAWVGGRTTTPPSWQPQHQHQHELSRHGTPLSTVEDSPAMNPMALHQSHDYSQLGNEELTGERSMHESLQRRQMPAPGVIRRARSATVMELGPYPQRSHSCPVPTCELLFKRRGHLKRHVLIHTQERSYICPHCNKAFSRSDNLAQHRRTHVCSDGSYGPYGSFSNKEEDYKDKDQQQPGLSWSPAVAAPAAVAAAAPAPPTSADSSTQSQSDSQRQQQQQQQQRDSAAAAAVAADADNDDDDDDDATMLRAFIERYVSLGYAEEHVVAAMRATTMDTADVGFVIEALASSDSGGDGGGGGGGTLPRDMPGVWTAEDDRVLWEEWRDGLGREGGGSGGGGGGGGGSGGTSLAAVERKHGRERCARRMEFLRDCEAEGA